MRAMATRVTAASANVSGSLAVTPKRSVPRARVAASAPARPTATPAIASSAAFADDERADGAGLRAEREADAHLALAAAHRVAQHAVEADSRERQREERVSGNDQQREAFLRDAAADDVGEHARLVEDQRGIDRVELASDVVEQARRSGDPTTRLRSAPSCDWLRTGGAGDRRSTASPRARRPRRRRRRR